MKSYNVSSTEVENQLSDKKSVTYVVVRDGYRVEDSEYEILEDPIAISVKEFWTKVSKNHSWGEKVEIVQYDSKKHRVW